MPQPFYGFCYFPVTYLMEYAFAFTLHHGNSPVVRIYTGTTNSSRERHATDSQTDGQTSALTIMREVGGNNKYSRLEVINYYFGAQ